MAQVEYSGYLMAENDTALLQVKRAKTSINSATTDGAVVAAVAAKKIRVLSVAYSPGNAAATITFTTKPAGAGTAISPVLSAAANTTEWLDHNRHGWFETVAGEGLSATTSASGVATGVLVTYVEV